jgi:NDP-sugar pyrophosphorylase family protein
MRDFIMIFFSLINPNPSAPMTVPASMIQLFPIGSGSIIGTNTEIGNGSSISSNVSIYHNITIGNNCIIDAGTVIGADGFGLISEKKIIIKSLILDLFLLVIMFGLALTAVLIEGH